MRNYGLEQNALQNITYLYKASNKGGKVIKAVLEKTKISKIENEMCLKELGKLTGEESKKLFIKIVPNYSEK